MEENSFTLNAIYFFLKRSSRTTSPPPLGGSGSGSLAVAGTDKASGLADSGGTILIGGGLSAVAPAATPSPDASASIVSNWKPNCTAGSKKAVMASNGITRRSGTPPNDRPTSNASSLTSKSQN